MMAVGYNKVKTSFLGPRAASFAHRAVGDTILPITLLVFDEETTRATIHVAAGSALVGVLVLKVIVIRWWKSMQRFLPHLGLTVFGLFVVTWVTSAGDYLWS